MPSDTTSEAPHGWVWLDDDGPEHSPDPDHPHIRGQAEYGAGFRPATADEAISPDFFRCPEVQMRLVADTKTTIPTVDGRSIEVHQLVFTRGE